MVFQPAYGQARLGGAVNIRELALVDISAPLWRIGRSPEKLQIFLCYSPIAFCPVRELKSLAIVPIFKGLDLILAVFGRLCDDPSSFGKAGMGLADGWYAPPATL